MKLETLRDRTLSLYEKNKDKDGPLLRGSKILSSIIERGNKGVRPSDSEKKLIIFLRELVKTSDELELIRMEAISLFNSKSCSLK